MAAAERSTTRTLRIVRLLTILYHVLALAPLVCVSSLYALYWRAEALMGHGPRFTIDDPKLVMQGDLMASFLYSSVLLSLYCMIGGLGIFVVPALTWFLRHKYSLLRIALLLVAFVVGWVLAVADPSQRFIWFMD